LGSGLLAGGTAASIEIKTDGQNAGSNFPKMEDSRLRLPESSKSSQGTFRTLGEPLKGSPGVLNPLKGDLEPLGTPKMIFEDIDTIIKVKGGGLVGQAEAIKLGLARALCEFSPGPIINVDAAASSSTSLNTDEIRKQLKDKGYLTQDSRVKERRKYGLKKARKATQYNKR
jgi:small subunit ribosomal protein S9